ncbi:MAG: ABC transporter ATP-binding protein [Moraxellaceae bacterium]|nr:ABC transporter ATP-binding protein [Moraxellaceae bacterium]
MDMNLNAHVRAAQGKALSVRRLTHSYDQKIALGDVSFEVPAGEIVALLGPSGCGKSTLLKSIAGLIRPSRGEIRLDDVDLAPIPCQSRRIGMVFQSYALFPHMTVSENVAYGLVSHGTPRAERSARVEQLLKLVRLEAYGSRLPRELSGGQQQRVAVARALAVNPSLLLLDEPFGALDRALRAELQVELIRMQQSLGITTLIVTHDQEEAQTVADRLVLMNEGCVEQVGTPEELYDHPVSLFANTFMGHASIIHCEAVGGDDTHTVLQLPDQSVLTLPRPLGFLAGSKVVLTFRPEDAEVSESAAPGLLPARLLHCTTLGAHLQMDLQLQDGTPVKAQASRRARLPSLETGRTLFIQIDVQRCHLFPGAGATSST